MSTLNTEELKRIAELSGLELSNDELKEFAGQLKQVLDYSEEITNLALGAEVEATRSVNVFREDKAVQQNNRTILTSAPKSKDSYFVVPRILD